MKQLPTGPQRESSSLFRNQNRRYTKQSQTPNESMAYLPTKSNQQIKNQLASSSGNQRYSEAAIQGANSKLSTASQVKSREDSLVKYQLGRMSHSKNFIGDRRKRGKSSFYKKVADLSNVSQAFFAANKYPTTKEVSKASSPSESGFTLEAADNQVQEIHYQMVQFQQTCKKAVKN